MDRTLTRAEWTKELSTFTMRNAGRRALLEVDSSEIGAQEAERELPLRGVAYDRRDDRVEIMLGEQASVERRLTRTIEQVTSVDVLVDDAGRDRALRIVHDGAQTLLRFLDDDEWDDRPGAG